MGPRATVTVRSHPLWRIRLGRQSGRYLLHALSLAGLLACARFAIDPPRAVHAQPVRTPGASVDMGAEGFASLFARSYLTWQADAPQAHQRALQRFTGVGIEVGAGLQLPFAGSESVQWTDVVQEREPLPGEHVYTVAVQTDPNGLQYLSVSVLRRSDGSLALAGYPAFVGPPASGPADDLSRPLPTVEAPALTTVVKRALGNYLAGSATDLAADLAPGAQVSLPDVSLGLRALDSLQWARGGGAVLAVVQARGRQGAEYTLAYELNVLRRAGRWEISAVQMDPDT